MKAELASSNSWFTGTAITQLLKNCVGAVKNILRHVGVQLAVGFPLFRRDGRAFIAGQGFGKLFRCIPDRLDTADRETRVLNSLAERGAVFVIKTLPIRMPLVEDQRQPVMHLRQAVSAGPG